MQGAIFGVLVFICGVYLLLTWVPGLGRPPIYQISPAYGYFPAPNQNVYWPFHKTTTDSHGMRSPEFENHKPAGTLRLMFVGDSITYGMSVDQPQIFTELIRKELPRQIGRHVEVLNASADGWAIRNEQQFLETAGTFESDCVLLVLNTGDMTQRFVDAATAERSYFTSKRPPTVFGVLYATLSGHFTNPVEARNVAATEVHESAAESENLSNLQDLASFVHSRHSRLIVVYIPFLLSVPFGAEESAPRSLRDWAEGSNTPLLDLTAWLSSYPITALTLQDVIHYSPQGHRAIASSLEKLLLPLLGVEPS